MEEKPNATLTEILNAVKGFGSKVDELGTRIGKLEQAEKKEAQTNAEKPAPEPQTNEEPPATPVTNTSTPPTPPATPVTNAEPPAEDAEAKARAEREKKDAEYRKNLEAKIAQLQQQADALAKSREADSPNELDTLPIFPADQGDINASDDLILELAEKTNTAKVSYSNNTHPMGIQHRIIESYNQFAPKEELSNYNTIRQSIKLKDHPELKNTLKALQKNILTAIKSSVNEKWLKDIQTAKTNTGGAFRPISIKQKTEFGHSYLMPNFDEELRLMSTNPHIYTKKEDLVGKGV